MLTVSKYWVGQKVRSGFSVRWYKEPERTFWPAQYFPFLRSIILDQWLIFLLAFLQNPTKAKNKHGCSPLPLIALGLVFNYNSLSLSSTAMYVTGGKTQISTVKPVW